VIALRRVGPDDWREWRSLRLEALREAPYAFSSSLADWQGRGDTERRWRRRLESVPFSVIALLDGAAVGQVSGTACSTNASVELLSMWVAPVGRGRGVGDVLVEAVVDWARQQSANRVVLSVRHTNSHAIALYERNGFVRTQHNTEDGEFSMARRLRRSHSSM